MKIKKETQKFKGIYWMIIAMILSVLLNIAGQEIPHVLYDLSSLTQKVVDRLSAPIFSKIHAYSHQILLFRTGIAWLSISLYMLIFDPSIYHFKGFRWHYMLRGLLLTPALFLWHMGFSYGGTAHQGTLIEQMQPACILLLASLFFKGPRVRWYTWLTIGVTCLFFTFFIYDWKNESVSYGLLYFATSVILGSLVDLLNKHYLQEEKHLMHATFYVFLSIFIWTGVFLSLLYLLPDSAAKIGLEAQPWVSPMAFDFRAWAWMLVIGCSNLAFVASLLSAYKYAHPADLAIYRYLAYPLSLLVGYVCYTYGFLQEEIPIEQNQLILFAVIFIAAALHVYLENQLNRSKK